MALSVSELVHMPHLRLELVAGHEGAEASVQWAQTSDLDSPWEFMTEGELLMKNGRTLPKTAADQVTFLKQLSSVGICGLLVGIDQGTPRIASKTIATANDLALPLIVAPYSVSFATIGKAVAYAADSNEVRRLTMTEKVYDTIRRSVAEPSSQKDPLAKLSKELGFQLSVVDAHTGDVALEGAPVPPAGLVSQLVSEVHERLGAIPGVIHVGTEDARGLAVQVPDEEPTLLLSYGFRTGEPDTVLLQHVATAIAVLLAQQGMRREHDRRIGGELLSLLVDGRLTREEASSRLRRVRIQSKTAALVAIIGGIESGQSQLHVSLARRGIPHLLLRRSNMLYALLTPTDESLSVLRRRLGGGALIGISDKIGTADRLPAANQEAAWAARAAGTAPELMARYRDATLLSVLRDAAEARVVVDRVLGPLIDYDVSHDSEMVKTLDTFLRCRRSWQLTSGELQVHRQTVIYRIRRIEEITGRSLTESAHIAEFWLALRARELIDVRA